MATAAGGWLKGQTALVLGGSGLVGSAICRRLARLGEAARPAKIVIAGRNKFKALSAVERLQSEMLSRRKFDDSHKTGGQTESEVPIFEACWGDLFVRREYAATGRDELLDDEKTRKALLEDLFDDFDAAYRRNQLVHLIQEHRPALVVDSINTATGLSYQNVFDASEKLRQALRGDGDSAPNLQATAERLLLAQSVPQLIRHVRFVTKAAEECGVATYLKIGTTGTGGMGLNIPFTHSEDTPSKVLLAKNEAAFGHSGLLYLWSQTPGAPAVLELKPAATIGYRNIGVASVNDRYKNKHIRQSRVVELNMEGINEVDVRESAKEYRVIAPMRTSIVDTGENGVFTADEFMTITAPGLMELLTPEEIAEVAIEELVGVATGHNVLGAVRASVLGPGYRAGTQRHLAADELRRLESSKSSGDNTMPSVALGQLGPPELSKLLFEAHILAEKCGGSLGKLLTTDPKQLANALRSEALTAVNNTAPPATNTLASYVHVAPTIGVPVLLPGNTLLRGNNITVPEPLGHTTKFHLTKDKIEKAAQRGWVDLRENNILRWQSRVRTIQERSSRFSTTDTSGTDDPWIYSFGDRIDPPALVTWILAVEAHGHRGLD